MGAVGGMVAASIGPRSIRKSQRRQELKEAYAHFLSAFDAALLAERLLGSRLKKLDGEPNQSHPPDSEVIWYKAYDAYLSIALLAPKNIANATLKHLDQAYAWREALHANPRLDTPPPQHEDIMPIFRKDLKD